MSDGDFDLFHAKYCEGCGQLFDASKKIRANTAEPVHRVHIIEAIGQFDEVGETVATEEYRCEDCGGQVVKRRYVYPASNVPEPDFEPDKDQISGRDPEEDSMIAMTDDPGPKDFEEVREVPWLEDGDPT